MFWRLEQGERFDDVKGPRARARFKALVTQGKARGFLAFLDGEPVGWLSAGRRTEFKKLDRAPSLRVDDAARVHALPCFFVSRHARRQGVAQALLDFAVKALRAEGAEVLEGYPVLPPRPGAKHADAFTYTGTLTMFEQAGFEVVQARPKGKQRVRRTLR
jgi:GNAT superfamily N-acetyltransferase